MVQEFVFLPEVVQQEASPSATKEATMDLSSFGKDIVSEVMQSACDTAQYWHRSSLGLSESSREEKSLDLLKHFPRSEAEPEGTAKLLDHAIRLGYCEIALALRGCEIWPAGTAKLLTDADRRKERSSI